MYLIGLLLIPTLFCCALWKTGFGGQFVDPASLLMVTLLPLLWIVALCSVTKFNHAVRAAFSGGVLETQACLEHEATLGALSRIVVHSGSVATVIGLVKMLAAMDNPDHLLPALGVALLSLLYAAVFAGLIIDPLRCRIRLKAKADAIRT